MLRLERSFGHAVERVWRALTEPDELAHWFPSDEPLEVSESDPPAVLAGTWFGDELRFELRPEGDGCMLVFTHAFADRDTAARTAAGWDRCFARLEALFAGHPLGEAESLEDWLARPRALRRDVRRRPTARARGLRRPPADVNPPRRWAWHLFLE